MDEKNTVVTKQNNAYLIPASIVFSAVLISSAIFFSDGFIVSDTKANNEEKVTLTDNVRPVSKEDHIRGNPDADVMVVVYSDFECPFCKVLHDTLNTIFDKNEKDGDVAWVFRHLPLEQLHPEKARAVAVASECAGDLGGNDAFWNFSDRYFELTLTNNKTDIESVIPSIANELGLDMIKFNACLASGKFEEKIDADMNNAFDTGGKGTPWSIVIAPNGKTFAINGAQPKESIEKIINLAKNSK